MSDEIFSHRIITGKFCPIDSASEVFEFRLDRIIHFGVTCPWVPKRPFLTLSDR